MLLAAGRGVRMAPLSEVVAKPALEVLGEPLLASGWRLLVSAGCRPIVVNLHSHVHQVTTAARQAAGEDDRLLFSCESDLMGGAGGVEAVERHFSDGPVLVANADTWARLDLRWLRRVNTGDTIHLALLPHPDASRWRSVVLDEAGRVATILEPGISDPRPRYLFTGVQRLGAAVRRILPPGPSEWAEVWQSLQAKGLLLGTVVQGEWREAGDPEAYRRLVVDLLPPQGSWVHGTASISRGVLLEHSAVGAGCAVERGAELTDVVVTAGARIGQGCRLSACVVAGSFTLEPVTAQGRLLLPHADVPLISSTRVAQN